MSRTLQDWLNWQETLHPSEIDLGLKRVDQVIRKLLPDCYESLPAKYPFTIVSIAGTNGKGSTVAMLEAILSEAGYCVGSYTSPHLLHYNERIKVNQTAVADQLICDSFERIDRARDSISLTYFEFATLAAIDIFHKQSCDIVILEVGLGGRLDAVNVIDPDIALVTTVDIDHQDWLGNDRNTIGLEKAGIYRKDKPAIYGDDNLPDSIQQLVIEQNLLFYQFSIDYDYGITNVDSSNDTQWEWIDKRELINAQSRYSLPYPQLKGQIQLKNAANVLMILALLKDKFPATQAEIKRGLQSLKLAGRFQVVSSEPFIALDVAHNVQAVKILRGALEQLCSFGKINVIIGMLKDKDIAEVIAILQPIVNSWRIIELDTPRAMPAIEIESIIRKLAKHKNNQLSSVEGEKIQTQSFSSFEQAFDDYTKDKLLMENDEKLLVFGSFFTVRDALKTLKRKKYL